MDKKDGCKTGVTRTREDTLAHIAEIERAPTKTGKKKLRTEYGVKEVKNHFLDLHLDLNL